MNLPTIGYVEQTPSFIICGPVELSIFSLVWFVHQGASQEGDCIDSFGIIVLYGFAYKVWRPKRGVCIFDSR